VSKNDGPRTTPYPARRAGSRPLAELVNRMLDPLVAKQGFSETALLTQWETIVGKRIGGLCQPLKLNWPPRPRSAPRAGSAKKDGAAAERGGDGAPAAATLVLQVEPGFGLDIQHSTNAIIERVNTHLGWRCVARISFKQEPLQRAAPKRIQPPAPDPKAREQASKIAEGFGDEALKAALIRLGERVLSKTARR
jgi:hypothetical protein